MQQLNAQGMLANGRCDWHLGRGEGCAARRIRLRHLSLRSTEDRWEMARRPSFLMSAHLPGPHTCTPCTSVRVSSTVLECQQQCGRHQLMLLETRAA